MLRILRAFAWLRWRILLNTLERSTSRDLVERFALGIDQLSPVLLALVLIPSAVSVAATGAAAGWLLARGPGGNAAFDVIRVVLLGAFGLSLLGPLLFRAGGQLPTLRLRLLPVPEAVLYLAQSFAALTDAWILLALAAVLGVAGGLGAAAAAVPALVATAAGLLLVTVLAGANAVVSAVLQILLRNRRRGEILALAGMLLVAAIGVLPGLLDTGRALNRTRGAAAGAEQEVSPAPFPLPESGLLPSEWYATAVADSRGPGPRPLGAFTALAAAAAASHAIAFLLFARIWRSPGLSTGGRTARAAWWGRIRVPGTSTAASAVAVNQVRLALRTPRGRSAILSPVIVFGVFAVLLVRSTGGTPFEFLRDTGGIGLAAAGALVSLLAILPFAVNQFAIDGAGLTLTMLAPIETRALLAGKATGTGIVAALPAGLCTAAAALIVPGGHPALWLSVPLWFVSTWLLAAPAAAALSAVFPRAVDLSSVGSGSNAHGAATLLGMLATAAAAAPPALLGFVAARTVDRPAVVPVLLAAWCGLTFLLSRFLFRGVRQLFDRRRENLALLRSRG